MQDSWLLMGICLGVGVLDLGMAFEMAGCARTLLICSMWNRATKMHKG